MKTKRIVSLIVSVIISVAVLASFAVTPKATAPNGEMALIKQKP